MARRILYTLSFFFIITSAHSQQVTMGVYENYPLVYSDENGEPQGLFVDILRYAAEREGWQVSYKKGSVDDCYLWLKNNEIDLIPEFPDYKDKSVGYKILASGVISSWARVYGKEGSDYTSLLDLHERKIAILKKSHYIKGKHKGFEHAMKELDLECNLVEAESYEQIFQWLQDKEVDAGIVDRIYGDVNGQKFGVEQTPIVFSPFRLSFIFSNSPTNFSKLSPLLEEHVRVLKADKNSLLYTDTDKYFNKTEEVEIPVWAYILMALLALGIVQMLLYVKVLRRMVSNRTNDLRNAYADIKSRQHTLSLIYNNASELLALFEVADNNILIAKLPDWYLEQLSEANDNFPAYNIAGMPLRTLYRDFLKLDASEIEERMNRLNDVLLHKENVVFEEWFKSPKGKRGYAETTLIPILGKNNLCTHILYVSRNITHQKRMLADLTETKNRLQMAIEGAREGMWDWDVASNEVIFNDHQASMLGFKTDVRKANFTEFTQRIHPEDRDKTFYSLMQHLNNESEFYEAEYRVKTNNGRWKWMMVHGKVMERDEKGKALRVIGTHVDIHDRKKVELALKRNQRRLSTLMSNLPGMVYRCKNDQDWTMLFVSEGAKNLTGYEPSDFINKKTSFSDITLDKYREKLWADVQVALNNHASFTVEYEITTKSGEKKWVWEQGREVEDGVLEGFISDISERKNSREKIIATIIETEDRERQRIAKELHDSLGQKLTTVSLNFNSLKKDIELNNTSVKKLNTGLNYLKEAIKDSREIAHNLMPQSIQDFGYVLSVQSLLADIGVVTDTKFEFYDNLDGARLPKNIELHLYRVTQEAVNNVLKYAKAKHVNIQLMLYEDEVVLTIEDDGVGFDYQKKMEDENQSFGLRSMTNRINSIFGSIEIDSSKGNGTVVIVEVPIK
ncbi:PAS domain-containing protein [Fulvivirga ligni]|uniref:PAS domain-containing protein n=1 Tax=Fulvivirga ligni TaxID=2904246 RepID=UPI001F2814C7|nr:PAS domain-containing protein [Fulvivirga ligni]UII20456.1 PAS domain-containing protein [Fulvivirga ligni]